VAKVQQNSKVIRRNFKLIVFSLGKLKGLMTGDRIDKMRKQVKNGFHEGEIRMQLQKEGLSAEEIKEILTAPKADMRWWYLLSAILVLLLSIYVFSKTGIISLLFFGLSGLLFYEYYKEQREQ
jgi:hypothetical protein